VRIINCCGYGNTGCTAQTDFLSDHKGVAGAMRPYHELGILKCVHSFGGIVLGRIQNWKHIPTRNQLKLSLMGQDPNSPLGMTDSANMHLKLREILSTRTGDVYETIIDDALKYLPVNYAKMDVETLIPHMRSVVGEFIKGLISNLQPSHFPEGEYDPETSVIGFKNDPPGSYPLFATLLGGGRTSAILRDPRDTTYDFNRHYGLGHTIQTVMTHCAHYNAQLNSAKAQITQYEMEIQPFYTVIDFENLVMSESFRNRYRDHMIGPRERLRFSFEPKKSSANIGHHTNMTDEFIRYVEENCMENYVAYRAFLKDRDMLLE